SAACRSTKLWNTEKNQEIAASKAGMDPATARRYLGLERLPSELKKERQWRTREDPFGEVWDAVQQQIQESPGLQAKTLLEWLQRS
ncbi:MAG: IS21 family transposase, partial [Bryobacteraceae bacterium]